VNVRTWRVWSNGRTTSCGLAGVVMEGACHGSVVSAVGAQRHATAVRLALVRDAGIWSDAAWRHGASATIRRFRAPSDWEVWQ
jgi:hypothetical protein